jgi:hypothetical protein
MYYPKKDYYTREYFEDLVSDQRTDFKNVAAINPHCPSDLLDLLLKSTTSSDVRTTLSYNPSLSSDAFYKLSKSVKPSIIYGLVCNRNTPGEILENLFKKVIDDRRLISGDMYDCMFNFAKNLNTTKVILDQILAFNDFNKFSEVYETHKINHVDWLKRNITFKNVNLITNAIIVIALERELKELCDCLPMTLEQVIKSHPNY